MTPEEFAKLVEKVGEAAAIKIKASMEEAQAKLDQKIEAALKNNATKDEVKSLVADAIKEASAAAKAEYEAILKTQGEAIGELKVQINAQKDGKKVSFTKALMNAFNEQRELLDSIIKSGKQTAPFVVVIDSQKDAVTMGEDNTIGSGSTAVSITQDTGIISPIRKREEKYLQSVSVGSIGTARALWIEETDQQGTPIFIGEGDGKIALSSLWVEQTAPVKKIGVYGKVTTELMADLPQLISYIKNSLMKRLSVVVEDQLFNGNDTGDNLAGAAEFATAFSAGDLAALVDGANEFDVLTALALQVEVAHGIPNAVYIHPSTWAKMKTLKDENGMPIWKQYVTPGTGDVVFEGMKIITSTAVTAGEFIGGDMTVLNVLFREQTTIQIGMDGSDFTTNKKTILLETRLVQFASANDTPCLVSGDFETAIAALELVPVP
jgi:HK97 family phage major capsid protein